MKFLDFVKSKVKSANFGAADFFASFAAAFIIASSIFALRFDFKSLLFVRQYSLAFSVGVTISLTVVFAFLSIFVFKSKKPLRWVLLLSCVFLCAILAIQYSGDIFFCVGLSFATVLVVKYATEEKMGIEGFNFTDTYSIVITAVLVAAFTLAVFSYTAAKYGCFYHSAFDFGIFCQMFESMAETGLPTTTVERGRELSHFAVHFSPFFYLLLPGYMLFRTPLYLLFMQALGIALGAFAVRRICRTLGLTPGMSCLGAAAYLLFPTMANGCFYDFHENKFLSVLILWALVFILEKNRIGAGIFLFLVLTVKEDAFIYVLAICLWMIVTKRDRIFAVISAIFCIGWFFFACNMIQLCGGEIMSDRFVNYTANRDAGLIEAVRTCFIDIGYLIKEVFAGANTSKYSEMVYSGQKLEFILWTFIPVLFAPLLRKRPSELVLLIPLLVINMMPEWIYQFDVDFQYTYGTAALIIFTGVLFLSEKEGRWQRFTAVSMVCVSLVFTISLVWNKAGGYYRFYAQNRDKYEATLDAVSSIPEDASVTAYGYMIPHLWYVDDLQAAPKYYGDLVQTEYFVIDTRYIGDKHTNKMYECMSDDYELICEEGYVKIYKLAE